MNNFGRAVLAVGLSAVMTFTGPECFFQSGVEPVSVYAAEEKAVQSKIAGDNSEEGESTTEVTTEKKEESTTATESQESQTSSERDTSSGNTEHSQTEHTTESNTDQAEDTSGNSSHSNEEGTTQKKAKKDISSREDAEIRTKAIKKITDQLAEEDAPDGSDKTSTFIPKIYNDTRLAMKNNKEYIAGYVYFNQTDSAWNQNGYCIAKAG